MKPTKARARLSFVALLAVSFALLVVACSDKRTPEQQIQARLAEGVKALEDKDLNAAGELLSESYQDKSGRDRRKMKAIAFLVLRQGPVHLSLSDESIEVAEGGERAKVSLKVTALQTAAAPTTVRDLMPRGRALEVQLDLVKEGDDWRISAIEGDGMGARDFE